jgi:hypothetical protein
MCVAREFKRSSVEEKAIGYLLSSFSVRLFPFGFGAPTHPFFRVSFFLAHQRSSQLCPLLSPSPPDAAMVEGSASDRDSDGAIG